MNRSDIEALVRPNIRTLKPYSTARDEFSGSIGIFIDANECPYNTGYNRYPDPHQRILKEKLSTVKKIETDKIFIGNGSDEAVDVIYRVFCRPGIDNVVSIAPSYGMYSVVADINDIEFREVLLTPNFEMDVKSMLAACDDNTKLMFICSPNNPSGNAFPLNQIIEILDSFKGILVVDEAYVDFSCEPSLISKLDDYPNLIVLQTLSKARGMAALRVGFAFSSPYIISLMSKVKYPYNINAPAQQMALQILDEDIEARVATIKQERVKVTEAITKYKCVKKVFPSDANFVLVKVDNADATYDFLLSKGIIVRNRNRVANCEGCIRITIGTEDENIEMLKALKEYEQGNICR